MRKFALAFALCLLPSLVFAQVYKNPTGLAMDCPTVTGDAAGGAPDRIIIDFFACDVNGQNCASTAEFSSPNNGGGLLVTDPAFVHLPNTTPATCQVAFTTIPYPIGKTYVAKGRFANSIGTSVDSSPTGPFTTPLLVPLAPVNFRTYP